MNINEIAKEYISRQARLTDPHGKFDRAGRWYPAENEMCKHCHKVRPPSRNWKYSYLLHCRTMKHIASLYDVSIADLRKAVKSATSQNVAEEGSDVDRCDDGNVVAAGSSLLN